jgi:hypothetical protein
MNEMNPTVSAWREGHYQGTVDKTPACPSESVLRHQYDTRNTVPKTEGLMIRNRRDKFIFTSKNQTYHLQEDTISFF